MLGIFYCKRKGSFMTMKARAEMPSAANSSNFNVVAGATTAKGTTLDNLKAAVCGETGASAKYAEFSAAAESQGFPQLARLFKCTSAAEQIHIKLETTEIQKKEPGYQPPVAPSGINANTTDSNLIESANGEIHETSDMYPTFIKTAQEEGEAAAETVFTRAKLAEAVHAELYLDAYNNIDAPDDDAYYLCPVCGYVHKGDDFEKCPICFAPKQVFQKF